MKNRTTKYLLKIYHYSKKSILKLWLFDAFGIIYECVEPLLLGLVIDGLIKKQYVSFICFVAVFLIDTIITYFNDVEDDVVYNEIKHKFKTDYYSTAVRQKIDVGIIDVDSELIEEPIEFVRHFAVNIINIVGMTFIPFLYIYFSINAWIGRISLLLCFVFILIGMVYNKKQLPTLAQIYKLNEEQRDKVESRDVKVYSLFLRKRHQLITKKSRLDAKSSGLVNLIILLIMASSLLILSNKVDITIGTLYAGLEYIAMLISGVSTIPDMYYDYKNTEICVKRIDIE